MVQYTCERCGRVFSQKGHYTNHQKRKNPCKPIENKIIEEKVLETLKELSIKGDTEIKNKDLLQDKQKDTIDSKEIENKMNKTELHMIDLFCRYWWVSSKALEDKLDCKCCFSM